MGCASVPPPPLTDFEAQKAAYTLHKLRYCVGAGFTQPPVAAYGVVLIKERVASYTNGLRDMGKYENSFSSMTFNNAECNKIAMEIHEQKLAADKSAEQAAYTAKAYKEMSEAINPPVKRTYCYQVGAQTMCSTQ